MAESDRYRKLFGEVALELGLVTTEQLLEGLTVQARSKAHGEPDKLLGQILLELGYMEPEHIQSVIDRLYPPSAEDDEDIPPAGEQEPVTAED